MLVAAIMDYTQCFVGGKHKEEIQESSEVKAGEQASGLDHTNFAAGGKVPDKSANENEM